jgi:2-polyprenyl-3-methyl-5-hydroxy-6-metoxy-1,4-benzoquinol methylase
MSIQNKKTLEVYNKCADKYLKCNAINDSNDMVVYKKQLYKFISNSLKYIPKNSKVLEVGAADGSTSLYIKELGYDITSSDIAPIFIKEIKKKNLKCIKFNILEDKFIEKYNCIYCSKVFVHFTKKDILKTLNKSYKALENNGIIIFNLISREIKKVDSEWIDFPGDYSIGKDRYFRYYYKEDIDNIISKTKFKILKYNEEIGIEGAKWLVYILVKEV